MAFILQQCVYKGVWVFYWALMAFLERRIYIFIQILLFEYEMSLNPVMSHFDTVFIPFLF